MFNAHCVTVRDPLNPWRHRDISTLTGPAPIKALAPITDRPFIILRNSEPVLRKDWDQEVKSGDLMAVVMLPQGGDDSNVGQILAMIVVAVLSYYTGGAVGAAYGSTAGSIASAAVGIIGSALVSAMFGPPKASGNMTDNKAASPTYNIAAQGNQARLESSIPIQYGRMLSFPDFAAAPYVEYAGNEQYLYQLFCIGEGEYDIEAIRIEDTPIANFEEVQTQIVQPYGQLTLFPYAVTSSDEVAGQELIAGAPVGPFVANSSGTQTNRLAVDVVCPRGLYFATDEGALLAKSMSFTVRARAVDDDGAAIGGWVVIGSESISAATTTPLRRSYSYSVTAGRYEVEVYRTDAKDTSTRAGHELVWAGLRAYLTTSADFGNVTLLAVKIRATNNLSQQASRKINVISTRKLFYWTGASWAGPVATRSIAWALADACRAVGLADSRIDLDGLVALDAEWQARGDTFDGRFDNTQTFWESLTSIGMAGRCKPYMQGGVVNFRRDAPVTVPAAMYSMRNIIRGSFGLEFITPSDDTADAVQVTYFDESTWRPRRVTCAMPDSAMTKPAKVELFGVTNREQAYREGTYLAAANRYRRTLIKFSTEMDGFIPSFGDLVAINHDLPQWGQHAEIVSWDEGTLTMTLSEPMNWDSGSHYIGMRRRDGSVSGPYAVTAGDSVYKLVLSELPDFDPYIGQEEERTHITFGWGETWRQLARVLSVRPRDEYTVELICINEDVSVHTADDGILSPPVNSSQLPATPSAPVIVGLSARSMVGQPDKMLLTWQPAPGAEYYIVEQSADGETWTRSGETRAANFTAVALYASQTIVRVAAVGQLRGSYAILNYALEADYMWASNDTTPMWTADTNLMWRY
jgi:hypothetical protein